MGDFYYKYRNLFYEEKESVFDSFYRRSRGKPGFLERGETFDYHDKRKLMLSPIPRINKSLLKIPNHTNIFSSKSRSENSNLGKRSKSHNNVITPAKL